MTSNPGPTPQASIRTGTIVLCAALLWPGCADPSATRATSTIGGTAVGALAGGLLGGERGAIIGALAGTAAGYAVGSMVYKRQMHLEAQKAASRARADQAQSVLQKYRDYNANLEAYLAKAREAVKEINTGQYTEEQRASARQRAIAEIDKAKAGAEESVEAIKEYRAKVEATESTATDEAKRQQLLQEMKELDQEKERLMAQWEELLAVRGQASGA